MSHTPHRPLFVAAAVAAIVSMLVAGCAKRPAAAVVAAPPSAAVEDPPPPPVPPLESVRVPELPPAPPSEDELFARKTLEQLNGERPLGEVFFDLDEAGVRDDARQVLLANAEWLKRWPSTSVTVEGHCDARGTAEYNLALGQRRANAVKDYLVALGVDAGRLAAVSKGKESPVCHDEQEGCWRLNRRAQPIITGK